MFLNSGLSIPLFFPKVKGFFEKMQLFFEKNQLFSKGCNTKYNPETRLIFLGFMRFSSNKKAPVFTPGPLTTYSFSRSFFSTAATSWRVMKLWGRKLPSASPRIRPSSFTKSTASFAQLDTGFLASSWK